MISDQRSEIATSMAFDAQKKQMTAAFLLWFGLGHFGAHRFYLERRSSAIAMLATTIISIPLCFVLVGFIGLIAVGVWWIVDGFLIGGMVEGYNTELAANLSRPLRSSAGFRREPRF